MFFFKKKEKKKEEPAQVVNKEELITQAGAKITGAGRKGRK